MEKNKAEWRGLGEARQQFVLRALWVLGAKCRVLGTQPCVKKRQKILILLEVGERENQQVST